MLTTLGDRVKANEDSITTNGSEIGSNEMEVAGLTS